MSENLKTYAHIVENKVVNVSLWSEKPELETEELLVEIADSSTAGIGWDYEDGIFTDNRPPLVIE
jgi:hypothetical protein